jgi:ABC-type antimicrobial peptide transport system permease subunit
MALGAAAGSVLRSVLGRGLALTAAGLAVGLVLAALAGRALAALLYGVSAGDVGTLAGVAAVLIAVAILASWVPARRATRIDPVAALRVE